MTSHRKADAPGQRGAFEPGITVLLRRRGGWLRSKRVGLLSHAAAVDRYERTSADLLAAAPDVELARLFGPEHGFFGAAGAGAHCRTVKHPLLSVPVHSLYGATRRPTRGMLRGLDCLVIDLQDIAVRCYTYVSTLQYALQAAAACALPVVVADRPVPLAATVDGPVTEDDCVSFVSLIRAPLCYGMTPGETALWLRERLGLDVELNVAAMRGYTRRSAPADDWPPWIPPSPALISRESALCYPALVSCEALTPVDCGRSTTLPFRVFGSAWTRSQEIVDALDAMSLPGCRFHPHVYAPQPRRAPARLVRGVRLTVVNPLRYRPALTALAIIAVLQSLYGTQRVWPRSAERRRFFDTLWGTGAVRQALLDGETPRRIASGWRRARAAFARTRRLHLLYE